MPAWRPDGKELYYLNPAGAMMAAPITVTGSTFELGASVVLFPRASTAAASTRNKAGNTTSPATGGS